MEGNYLQIMKCRAGGDTRFIIINCRKFGFQCSWSLEDASGKSVAEYAVETEYQELKAHVKKADTWSSRDSQSVLCACDMLCDM